MSAPQASYPRAQRRLLGAGALLLAAGLVGLVLDPAQFMRSYLVAHVFWLGVSLGCLALALLHHLAGGTWGAVLLRPLEAGVRLLPVVGLAGVPLLFGLRYLYPWTDPAVIAHNPLVQHKAAYLNVPFFLVRTGLYYAVWLGLAYLATRWSLELDENPDPARLRRLRGLSAAGLLLLGLTTSFAAIDWLMSLEPDWYSTIYPAMVAMSAVLAAFALVVVVVAALARQGPMARATSPLLWNDYGNLLLAFTMLWMYLAFSQYLVIWSGNIREEVVWYLRRLNGGWQWVALSLVIFSFALPFLVLLSRELKRRAALLALVAGLVAAMRYLDLLWTVAPAFHPAELRLSWLDVVLPLGLGGLWLGAYLRQLARGPLLPLYDARVRPRAEVEHARS